MREAVEACPEHAIAYGQDLLNTYWGWGGQLPRQSHPHHRVWGVRLAGVKDPGPCD